MNKYCKQIVVLYFSLLFTHSVGLALFIEDERSPTHGTFSVKPAEKWQFAFVTGNGQMGAMVFGHPSDETIIANHARLFLPLGSREIVPNLAENVPELRTIIRRDGYDAAMDFFLEEAKKQGFPGLIWTDPFHPGFFLRIRMGQPGEAEDYIRTEDFSTGEVTVRWKDEKGEWCRKLFVSRPDNAIVLSITGPGPGSVDCVLAPELVKENRIQSILDVDHNWISYHNLYQHGKGGYDAGLRVISKGGKSEKKGDTIEISKADEVLVFMKIVTFKTPLEKSDAWASSPSNLDFRGETKTDFRSDLKMSLTALPGQYEKLFQSHVKEHSELFNRVSLDLEGGTDRSKSTEELLNVAEKNNRLPAALLEKMYDAGRYMFICSAGELPPNLQGIWTGTWKPAWSGDFTTDTNLQLAIKVGFGGNLLELMEGYFRLIEDAVPDFRLNAKRYFGSRGLLAPTRMSNNGLMLHWGRWDGIWWTAGAGWLAHFFTDYYHHTGDQVFLRERVVPLLKEVALFYEDFLLIDPETNDWEFIPSYSPESSAGINSTMDVMVAKEVLSSLIEACEELQIELDRIPKWKAMLSKMPGYRINEGGALAEWIPNGYPEYYRHRHLSHLHSVYEANGEFTPEKTPKLWKAAQKATRLRISSGGEESTHGRMHMGLAAATLQMPEEAWDRLKVMATEKSIYPSLICSHEPRQRIFNTDGNGSIPEIIHRMLISSRPGELRLLPALPNALQRGKIAGILCRQQLTVNQLEWNMPERTIFLELTSGVSQSIVLYAPPGTHFDSISFSDGVRLEKTISTNSRRIGFDGGKKTKLSINFSRAEN